MAKKRANSEGSIQKRKDGRWEGRYTAGHDPVIGEYTGQNPGRGQGAAESRHQGDAVSGFHQSRKIHGGGVDGVWFEDYSKIKVRPSSHQTYRGYIDNHIRPNIGDIPLEKLTSLDLQKLYKKLLTKGRVDRLEAKG